VLPPPLTVLVQGGGAQTAMREGHLSVVSHVQSRSR
jgi:hypothetical protein